FRVEAAGGIDGRLGERAAVVLGRGDGGGDAAGAAGVVAEHQCPPGGHGARQAVDELAQRPQRLAAVAGQFGEHGDLPAPVDGAGERADRVDLDAVERLGGGDEGVRQAAVGQVHHDVVDDGAVGGVLHHVDGADVAVRFAER